jgi:predicted anti-sigma-YlaC factor YlaD
MNCSQARELISARIDGECGAEDGHQLDSHLARCAVCHAFEVDAISLTRAARLRPAEPVPDLSAAILRTAAPARTRWAARPSALASPARWLLGWVALCELAFALPVLLFGSDSGATPHVARHLGSFDIAIAIGLLFASIRPARAAALLPVAGALTACLLVSSALDLADGSTTAGLEAHHLIEIVGFGLLWLVAGAPRPRRHALS